MAMSDKFPKHGVLGTIVVRSALLMHACINTDCEWHTSHWRNLYENGCYMLTDNRECISGEKTGFTQKRTTGNEHD